MLLTGVFTKVQRRLERRRRYNLLAAEIHGLGQREIADLNIDRNQMLHDLKREIYG